ncbi:Protein of unknown function DUF3716 [Penicillium brevicompactum]|uniref:Protein of unknown function DUF3716 n=1 Tax=Penicillium brevicompactum TaxID=5074 RepID=UPI0025400D91|nr:Protein of unknown function DUF3716 [Penicillium brevicompactum]KAJ5337269.1 Protein of unknown function DUF3716 [Penicillium brevicompactum]
MSSYVTTPPELLPPDHLEISLVEIPPGPWAQYSKMIPWKSARCEGLLLSDLVACLAHLARKRDLSVVPGSWTRTDQILDLQLLKQDLHENLHCAEAALIYMTGDTAEVPCTRCLKKEGVFSVCVVSNEPGAPRACANCWYARGKNCSITTEAGVLATRRLMFTPPCRQVRSESDKAAITRELLPTIQSRNALAAAFETAGPASEDQLAAVRQHLITLDTMIQNFAPQGN